MKLTYIYDSIINMYPKEFNVNKFIIYLQGHAKEFGYIIGCDQKVYRRGTKSIGVDLLILFLSALPLFFK